MERYWTAGSSGFRWPGTAGRQTPTTAAVDGAAAVAGEAVEDTVHAAAGVRGAGDAAVPEAGAGLVPALGPATADHARAPIPDPAPNPTLPTRGSPNLPPGPGHAQDPNPGPVPGAERRRPTESRGPGLKAHRSLLEMTDRHHRNSAQGASLRLPWADYKRLVSDGA